jgi:hypothetical protein
MIDFMFLFRASMCRGDLARYQLYIGTMVATREMGWMFVYCSWFFILARMLYRTC